MSQCQIKYPDVLEFCPRDGSPLPNTSAAKEVETDPLLGTTIDGRYAIESRLGEGGMGVVYKARHVLIDKPVAIKILRKEAAQDTAAVQRFIQEAQAVNAIRNEHIVEVYDFGEEQLPTGELRMTALDVGQGDAIVVELPRAFVLVVDGGPAATDGGPWDEATGASARDPQSLACSRFSLTNAE